MNPQLAFGTAGATNVHPAILTAMILAIILILALPRKFAVVPLFLLSFPIPMGQVLMVGPFHFQVFRILLFFLWVRLLWQRYIREGPSAQLKINALDKMVIAYSVTYVIAFALLWQQGQAFFDSLGHLYNELGFYFAFRFFIRDREDVERTLKVMAVLALVIAACMWNEQMTGRNVLAMFGGVPEHTVVREDYLRSQGPFRVFLTAGCFGATLVPLFLILWRKGGSYIFAAIGIISSLVIALTSHTSTAVSALAATVVGCGMWFFRTKMRQIRWGMVLSLTGLHMIMKAPVWALLARVDFVGGSTGYQRFEIVDNCIRHFWSWYLVGARDYWTWGTEDDMWDLANQYVAIAETSGLLCLIFFLAMIVYCFKYLGNARKAAGENSKDAWFFWLLGVALFSNLIAFLGISYFDQTFIAWYALLAMIVAATGAPEKAPLAEPESVPRSFSRPLYQDMKGIAKGAQPSGIRYSAVTKNEALAWPSRPKQGR